MSFIIPEDFGVAVDEADKKLNQLGRTVLRFAFSAVVDPALTYALNDNEIRPDAILGAMLSRRDIERDDVAMRVMNHHTQNKSDQALLDADQCLADAAEEFVLAHTDDQGNFEQINDVRNGSQEYCLRLAEKLATYDTFKAGPK